MSNLTEQLSRRREKSVPRGVGNMTPILIDQADGAIIRDVDGREYLDFPMRPPVKSLGDTSFSYSRLYAPSTDSVLKVKPPFARRRIIDQNLTAA